VYDDDVPPNQPTRTVVQTSMLSRRRHFVSALAIALASTAVLRAQSAQENAADAERLIQALALQTGQTVGEIGAGGGELTIALAKVVGESGRVLSNDINKGSLSKIGAAADKAGVHNVTLVEGRENETNFPESCCDAVFMRNVYHHFGDPPAMNASIRASLKPGGRLAIIDFTPPRGKNGESGENVPGRRAEDQHHGVTAATVARELEAAGFEILSSTESGTRGVLVVARRPPARGVESRIPNPESRKACLIPHAVAMVAAERGSPAVEVVGLREVVRLPVEQPRHAGQDDLAHVGRFRLLLRVREIAVDGVPHLRVHVAAVQLPPAILDVGLR